MEARDQFLLHMGDINAETRPKLADMLSIAEGSAYLLSTEILSATPGDERLVVLIMGSGSWGLIEDIPASPDGTVPEQYHAIILDEIASETMRSLIAPPAKVRKESTGRPPKYSIAEEGADILIQHIYEGQSIKAIAREHNMSPTTVQKLLNKTRLQAADNFLNGTWTLSRNSMNWEKNLKILQWAIDHSSGVKRQKYEQLMFRLLSSEE